MATLIDLKATIDSMIRDAEKAGKNPGNVPVAYALWCEEDVTTASQEHGIKLTDEEVADVLDIAHDEQEGSNECFWNTIHEAIKECRE